MHLGLEQVEKLKKSFNFYLKYFHCVLTVLTMFIHRQINKYNRKTLVRFKFFLFHYSLSTLYGRKDVDTQLL